MPYRRISEDYLFGVERTGTFVQSATESITQNTITPDKT